MVLVTSSSRRHFEGRSWQSLHRLRPVSIECLGRAADDRGRVLLDRASDTHRMRALLGDRGVVNHQHCIAAADEPIRLDKQLCLTGVASQTPAQ
jgi:hypothetical protein